MAAALTAVQELRPSAQASLPGRPVKVGGCTASLRALEAPHRRLPVFSDKAGLAWALAMDTAQQPDLRAFIEAASLAAAFRAPSAPARRSRRHQRPQVILPALQRVARLQALRRRGGVVDARGEVAVVFTQLQLVGAVGRVG